LARLNEFEVPDGGDGAETVDGPGAGAEVRSATGADDD